MKRRITSANGGGLEISIVRCYYLTVWKELIKYKVRRYVSLIVIHRKNLKTNAMSGNNVFQQQIFKDAFWDESTGHLQTDRGSISPMLEELS